MVVGPLLCSLLGILCPQKPAEVNVVKVDSLPKAPSNFVCFLDPIAGSCDGVNPRYFFDFKTGNCEQFNYGGCGGNMNNFETLGDCIDHCGRFGNLADLIQSKNDKKLSVNTCYLEHDSGPCKARFPRYYYDPASETCKQFIYGGCRGNDNNFVTPEDCIAACGSTCFQSPDPGPCRGIFYRFYYDHDSKSCQKFIYGGCKGNDNNYRTEDECMNSCGHTKEMVEDKSEEEQEPKEIPEKCTLERDTGPCKARFTRYFYNAKKNKCKTFIYGGCQGNDNNFITKEDCVAECVTTGDKTGSTGGGKKTKDPKCFLPSLTGPCRAAFTRYYYNPATGRCETFTYGSCRGNANNFFRLEDCEAECEGPGGEEEEEGNNGEDECQHEDDDPYSVCELPSDAGPCEAAIPRFFYNHFTKKCQEFTYGGCDGNANNFETTEECKLECGLSHH